MHKAFDLPLPEIRHVAAPYRLWEADARTRPTQQFSARLAAELEELIVREGPETVAAFIAEPIQARGRRDRAAGGLLRGDPGRPRSS